jgi:hypothetical protein
MDAAGRVVTIGTVAREAGVSRSWLYAQPDLRAEIQRLGGHHQGSSASPAIPARKRASDASLRRRLEAATSKLRRLCQENQQLREQLALVLGERRAARTHRPVEQADAAKRTGSTMTGPCW